MSAVDLSAAAAHLRQRAQGHRDAAFQWEAMGNRATAVSLRELAAEDDAVASLLEAIAARTDPNPWRQDVQEMAFRVAAVVKGEPREGRWTNVEVTRINARAERMAEDLAPYIDDAAAGAVAAVVVPEERS